VILALADQRLRGTARNVLRRVGSSHFTQADLALLQEALVESGIARTVEQMIIRAIDIALAALNDRALDRAGVEHLTRMAHQIAWRDK
jgi:geranylgeranyl diphosphate synthase, type I